MFTRKKSAGTLALYVDGAAAGTATGAGAQRLDSPATINFSRSTSGTSYFAGTMDEIATYDAVLTAATVSDHFGRR